MTPLGASKEEYERERKLWAEVWEKREKKPKIVIEKVRSPARKVRDMLLNSSDHDFKNWIRRRGDPYWYETLDSNLKTAVANFTVETFRAGQTSGIVIGRKQGGTLTKEVLENFAKAIFSELDGIEASTEYEPDLATSSRAHYLEENSEYQKIKKKYSVSK